jgi:hypothetical protein
VGKTVRVTSPSRSRPLSVKVSTPSSYSMTSAMSIRRTIVPDFHGTHTAASRQLPMC